MRQAPRANSSSWRKYADFISAGDTSPVDSTSRRWLNQSTYSEGRELDRIDTAPKSATRRLV